MRARSRSNFAIEREASSVRTSRGRPTSVIARPAESANAVRANVKAAIPTGRPSTRYVKSRPIVARPRGGGEGEGVGGDGGVGGGRRVVGGDGCHASRLTCHEARIHVVGPPARVRFASARGREAPSQAACCL